MTATPRIDRLIAEHAAPAILGINVRRFPGAADMGETPQIAPNPAGLDLLREIAQDMRDMRGDVGDLSTAMAEMKGADLPGQLVAMRAELALVKADVAALGLRVLAVETAARPWGFLGKEASKTVINACMLAALAAIVWYIKAH
jgi:hypothetical protein